MNTYGYVEGNPISYIDPTGETAVAPLVVPVAVGVAVGAGFCAIMPSHPSCVAARKLIKQCFTSDNDKDDEKSCEEEKNACSEMCSEAYTDPKRKLVVGGSMAQCIKNCLPERCGGEPKWKGFVKKR